MSNTSYPGSTTSADRNARSSKYADAVVGQARVVEADSTFSQTPGMSMVVFITAGLLFAAGAIAAAWAIFRVIAHA